MTAGILGIIIVASAFFLGITLAIRDAKNWERLIQEAGKPKETEKTNRFIFVEEEELGAEHAGLVASDTEEEEEALYWS